MPACAPEDPALFRDAIEETSHGFTPPRAHLAKAQQIRLEFKAIRKGGAIWALANGLDYPCAAGISHTRRCGRNQTPR
jgi:hypothetical protein